MPVSVAMIRARVPALVVTGSATTSFTNSPASNLPATRSLVTPSLTASGGTGTYAWTYVSGDASIACTSPAAAATTFSATVAVNTTKTAIWRVTSGAQTVDRTVSLDYDSGF